MSIQFGQFGVGVDVFQGARTYGPVRRGGRVHWRNYHRPISGGRSILELFAETSRALMEQNSNIASVMLGRRP